MELRLSTGYLHWTSVYYDISDIREFAGMFYLEGDGMKTKYQPKNLENLDDLFGEGARFRDTSQQIHKQWQADPARAFPSVGNPIGSPVSLSGGETSSPNTTPSPSPSITSSAQITHNGSYDQPRVTPKPIVKHVVHKVSSSSSRTPGVGADASITTTGKSARVSEVMELCYVTERIIALWYRDDSQGVLEHATNLLRGKHADNYMIFNLSTPGRHESNTRECGWPHGLAPSLERLCALCKELDSWLNEAPNRVVVLHARGGKERLGVAVSAYMNYSSICGGRDQALDRYAMRRFLDDKIGALRVPSHRRYIEYFSGLLSGSLRINPSPLYLTHVTVLGVPLFEPTGCRAFLKVYEGFTPVYTSDLYSVTNAREFTVNLGGLRLRGDILVKCYHRVYSKQSREAMFSLQFHTCVITENVVSFPRSELDIACDDPRCPSDSVVTLYFSSDAKRLDGPVPAPTPAVPHASAHNDPILHWDSYSNLEISDDEGRDTPLSPPPPSSSSAHTSPRGLGYTCGPIDGSLYAVVHQGAGGAARGSPLTVSMDSGISSAPPQRPSPPEAEPDSPHSDLDKLLHDMMMTVESMPDPPSDYNRSNNRGEKMYIHETRSYSSNPTSNYSTLKESCRNYGGPVEFSTPYALSNNYGTLKNESRRSNHEDTSKKSFSPGGNIDFIDEDIPYHARQTSQPFSYGATTDMIKHQKLSSPSLVRKAVMRGTAPIVDLDEVLGESTGGSNGPVGSTAPEPPPEFANGTKPNADHVDGLSWLRQQQLKLAARRDERSPGRIWRQETGNRVIGELRSLQRNRVRQDGYASDSAVLDDDDDIWILNSVTSQTTRAAPHTSAPASPLLPQRSSSRKFNGSMNGPLRPRAESVNERPFVSVKRAYEFRKYSDSQSPPPSPHASPPLLAALALQPQTLGEKHQPPRPESRSDSFGRAEMLMKEHRFNGFTNSLNGLTDNNNKTLVNNNAYSRNNRVTYSDKVYEFDGIDKDNRDVVDLGLLAVVDKSKDQDCDPLASLIESLADLSHVRVETINKDNQLNVNHHGRNLSSSNNNDVINTDTNSTPNQSPKAWQFSVQSQHDSPTSWTDRSVSPASAGVGNASRPQTPAFPVHPRTPYVNNSSPTVTFAADRTYGSTNNFSESTNYSVHNNNVHNFENGNNNVINNRDYTGDRAVYIEERRDVRETGLPPKSPTTQRRLSFPASGSLKQSHNKRWPLTNQSASFEYSKDRPVSPTNEITHTISRSPGTPNHVEFVQSPKSATSYTSINSGGHSSPYIQQYGSRRSSIHSNTEPQEVADVNVKFVRDTSKIWYKPNITREQAIAMLKDAAPGTFVVRDSNSFPGAFGLALKVATPPPGAPSSPKDPSSELVRHFLIEPTSRGVRLKGCANEPVFSSLSALVYQHSLMAMALPCQLLLPEADAAARALESPGTSNTQQLLAQGAACNVLYLFTIDTESLTGPQAVRKAVTTLFDQKPLPSATIVHFKVSTQGITLTDNARKLFFRRHYPTNNISYCGLDADERTWEFISEDTGKALSAHRCFGFVARKPAHKTDNQCHVFAELEPGQPATAIVNFVNKVMMGSSVIKANIV
ncbi:tensin-1 isoform X3 [Diachasmimorpha longicaudata]|uniref:tensin-1 isoform X3 n=2 Tax=Diachasmimorpha longicaudata TaxID=58733 RepID=UPI0030B8B780